jgi:hypothetical protein
MGDVEAADIAQLNAFELLPEPLARVQLRSIGRQALQMQPRRCAIGEEISDDPTAMDRSAVPDNDYAARYLAP